MCRRKILYTFLALFIWSTQSVLKSSRMGKRQHPLESIKFPFKLQSDLSMFKTYKQKDREVQPLWDLRSQISQKNLTMRNAYMGRSKHRPCSLHASGAGSTFLCFPLSCKTSPAHTSLILPCSISS